LALGDITREAVIAAIAEYDELGQDQFLNKYGFERARSYVLVHGGKSSKAIVGAAHGFLPGRTPVTARQFSGGEARVGQLLRGRGFIVRVGDALTAGTLVNRLAKLRVYRSGGLWALYQPITLLWAFAHVRVVASPGWLRGYRRNKRSARRSRAVDDQARERRPTTRSPSCTAP
jgi:5-methylcytosine-specific restriction protein A